MRVIYPIPLSTTRRDALPGHQRGDRADDPTGYGIAAVESHTRRIEIIPRIFVVSFTLFSPLNINGHMLSGVMAQEVTTAYNTRVLTLFYCLQISSIVFSYTSILSREPSLPLSSLPSFSFTSSFIGVPSPSSLPLFYRRLSFFYRYLPPRLLSLALSLRFSSSSSSRPTSVSFRSFSLSSPSLHPPPSIPLALTRPAPRCIRSHYIHRDAHYFPFVSSRSRFLPANFFASDKCINLRSASRS